MAAMLPCHVQNFVAIADEHNQFTAKYNFFKDFCHGEMGYRTPFITIKQQVGYMRDSNQVESLQSLFVIWFERYQTSDISALCNETLSINTCKIILECDSLFACWQFEICFY